MELVWSLCHLLDFALGRPLSLRYSTLGFLVGLIFSRLSPLTNHSSPFGARCSDSILVAWWLAKTPYLLLASNPAWIVWMSSKPWVSSALLSVVTMQDLGYLKWLRLNAGVCGLPIHGSSVCLYSSEFQNGLKEMEQHKHHTPLPTEKGRQRQVLYILASMLVAASSKLAVWASAATTNRGG